MSKKKAIKKIVKGTFEIASGGAIIVGGSIIGAALGAGVGTVAPVAGTAAGAAIGAGMGAAVAAPLGGSIIKSGGKDIKNGVQTLFSHNPHTMFHSTLPRQPHAENVQVQSSSNLTLHCNAES